MASPRKKTGDKFSFPAISTAEKMEYSDQFEFGCVTNTPTSPHSPADHLFFNGKLLPHVFPTKNNNSSFSRSTSRTSSSSKDSLMSSRSNSMNSRNSNFSSARTSTSEACERKSRASDGNIPGRKSVGKEMKLGTCQYQYGSSQRWQFIACAPVLMHQGSRSRKVEKSASLDRNDRKGSKNNNGGEKSWFPRIIKSFLSACKECHAITTTSGGEGVLSTSLDV